MHLDGKLVILVLFAILLSAGPALTQEAEHQEHGEAAESAAHDDQHEAEHEEHGEDSDHSRHHLNDVAVFLGVTDEHGHPSEFTWGLDYRRLVAKRWAVGVLFDYAGGDLRNAILGASVTWFPYNRLQLTAAPGIEYHRGRGSDEGCDCPHSLKSGEGDGHSEVDEDETYFVFRLGVGWYFPVGQSYGIIPQVNLDLVDGEKVWVYGLSLAYAW